MFRSFVADSRRRVLPAPVKPNPQKWSDNRVTISWLGHATLLINFYGVRVLIDPVFSNRVGVDVGIGTVGPKRYVAPALSLKEIPAVDVTVLSHAHYDHIDVPSLKRLSPGALLVTARNTKDVLPIPQKAVELRWGEDTVYKGPKGSLQVEAFEVRHWGKRWPSKIDRGYNGYILRREGKAILFGGDTAHTPLFKELRGRGPYAIAVMPIGAYRPWIHSHCTPEEALEMVNVAGGKYIVPIHPQTFKLSEEPMQEPLQRMEAALSLESERLALRRIGETFVHPV
jgi:L-ascorbate metabolism protein UlaG (beta-lactamase superfamily)